MEFIRKKSVDYANEHGRLFALLVFIRENSPLFAEKGLCVYLDAISGPPVSSWMRTISRQDPRPEQNKTPAVGAEDPIPQSFANLTDGKSALIFHRPRPQGRIQRQPCRQVCYRLRTEVLIAAAETFRMAPLLHPRVP
jgi:hypothetical protein